MSYVETFLYVLTVALTKASILIMYRRVLPSTGIRRNVYICFGLVLTWLVAIYITNLVACVPVFKDWESGAAHVRLNWRGFYYGMQIPNILTDIFIVVMPIREVFSLRLTKIQKAILVGIFGIAML